MAVDLGFEYGLARFIDFRDAAECERVRRISRAEITQHANPDFRIRVVDDPAEFYRAFAADLVGRIRAARDEGRTFVAILPVGPMPQYELAARMINEERLSLAHVHTFNMDEYANEDGVTAPVTLAGLVPAGDAGALLRARRRGAAAAGRPDPLPDHGGDRRLQRAGSRTSAAPTSATAASAGAATSRSGSRTSATSSPATSRPTSRRARGSSSCTR